MTSEESDRFSLTHYTPTELEALTFLGRPFCFVITGLVARISAIHVEEMLMSSRTLAVVTTIACAAAAAWHGRGVSATEQGALPANCVTIATPKPSVGYTYDHAESTGNRSQYTQHWESVTTTGSRVRVTGPRGTEIQVSEHHIVEDVMVLDRQSKTNAKGGVIDATAFRPGLVGDPAFRACAGRSWPIPSVTATYQSTQTKASAGTPAGTLKIVAIREKVTVPAGQFDTVHYIRTSQSTDEYWKSIDHGVVVKHIATLPRAVVTEVLVSIK